MTKLNEKRDELAEFFGRQYPRRTGHTYSFKAGFDAALAEVMPMMREMRKYARHNYSCDELNFTDECSCGFSGLIDKYTELVGK